MQAGFYSQMFIGVRGSVEIGETAPLTRSVIYTVDHGGTLVAMRPSEPRSEDAMQKLVAEHPELVADQDGALLLIRREQPISDREDGSGRWSLDHLFVTRSGIPVLVEVKRAVDTRLRREVIGQILDYAANGTAYWQGGRIAESFIASMAARGLDADTELTKFLHGAGDPQQFWAQVDANFTAGRVKLVIVADVIPPELVRIIEFLNEQMKADVRAVELSWFESESGVTALTPRIIGETGRAQTEKTVRNALPRIGLDEWIEANLSVYGPDTVRGAKTFVTLVENCGGRAEVGSRHGSILAFDLPVGGPYPFALVRYGKGMVQLALNNLVAQPAFADENVRRHLHDQLSLVAGPLTTKTLNGWPCFPVTKLNSPDVQSGVAQLMRQIRDTGTAP